ncbi:hypothetical protein P7C70_g5106, partial [Phenoliferia sp. Uapishka_3]
MTQAGRIVASLAPHQTAPAGMTSTRAAYLKSTFSSFRSELDEHVSLSAPNQQYLKAGAHPSGNPTSRITNEDREVVFKEAEKKLRELRNLFAKMAVEVQGEEFWRCASSSRPARWVAVAQLASVRRGVDRIRSTGIKTASLQESRNLYVILASLPLCSPTCPAHATNAFHRPQLEAFTFYHYLVHSEIPSLPICQAAILPLPRPLPSSVLPSPSRPATPSLSLPPPSTSPAPPLTPVHITVTEEEPVHITEEDYLGGVADLTGELMRLAITRSGSVLGSEKGIGEIGELGRFVRDVKGEMDPLAPYARWLGKKLTVLDQSLAKIENVPFLASHRPNSKCHLEVRLYSGEMGSSSLSDWHKASELLEKAMDPYAQTWASWGNAVNGWIIPGWHDREGGSMELFKKLSKYLYGPEGEVRSEPHPSKLTKIRAGVQVRNLAPWDRREDLVFPF